MRYVLLLLALLCAVASFMGVPFFAKGAANPHKEIVKPSDIRSVRYVDVWRGVKTNHPASAPNPWANLKKVTPKVSPCPCQDCNCGVEKFCGHPDCPVTAKLKWSEADEQGYYWLQIGPDNVACYHRSWAKVRSCRKRDYGKDLDIKPPATPLSIRYTRDTSVTSC